MRADLRSTLCLCVLVAAGCAQGEDGRRPVDAGSGDATTPDAGVDGSIADGAADAETADAETADADAGDTPIACTPETAAEVCGARPCVDGYCCDAPCDGDCVSCGLAGSEGACSAHLEGSDPDDDCGEELPATCGTSGACDGAGACAVYGTDVSCDDGLACTADDACDGAGTCRGDAPPDCAPAEGNECCVGSCDTSGGCTTEAGSCADICGGSSLSVGRTCSGCGAARAAGACLGGSIFQCDASNHSACQEVSCGGVTYYCTPSGGTWAWRTNGGCDDGDACTFGDTCGGGTCAGATIDCSSTTCLTRSCNGTASCTETINAGSCDDGDPCTYGDACDASGACSGSGAVICDDRPCLARSCNGSASCTETPLTGSSCDDGDLCTTGEVCDAAGTCGGGSPVTCPGDTTCLAYTCDGTAMCASSPQNVGGACDDSDSGTSGDVCQMDGTCVGLACTPTLNPVFAEYFETPSSSSWTNGSDVQVNTSRWNAFTNERHGVRITSGRMEITNERSGSADHGHGFAYVRAGGAGAHYNTGLFDSTLANNAGQEVVWSFNMRHDNDYGSEGGFSCSSTSSQNGRMIGLAYVIGATTAAGLVSNANSCSPSGSANGYAVLFGGDSDHLRLVRFQNGLRNGALTTIARSSNSYSRSSYFSVRVTYNATNDTWQLEVRRDGSSSFSNPAAGSYGDVNSGTDATFTSVALDYTGPYFQTGCCCLCDEVLDARFDNVTVGLRCAP